MTNSKDAVAFAAARSHANAQLGYDSAKALAQAVILINGGAATAVLTFISKDTITQLQHPASYCLFGYALGVTAGAFMLYALFATNHYWNQFWQIKHIESRDDERMSQKAVRWRRRAALACFLSLFCFVAASGVLAYGFFHLELGAAASTSIIPLVPHRLPTP